MLTFVASRASVRTIAQRAAGLRRSSAMPEGLSTGFDWMDEKAVRHGELPDVKVDEATIKKAEEWYKSIQFEDVFQDEKAIEEATNKEPEGPNFIEMFVETPLPSQAYPANMEPEAVTHRLFRYEELLKSCIQAPQTETMVEAFLKIRQEGFIPAAEWYYHLISKLLNYGEFEAMDYLAREMKELNYKPSAITHSAFIYRALIQQKTEEMETLWKAMVDDGFEASEALLLHKLFYYGRFTDSLDNVLSIYDELRQRGFKDLQPANLLLAICRTNNLLELGEKVYAEAKAQGLLDLSSTSGLLTVELDGKDMSFPIKAQSAMLTETVMAQLYCAAGKEQEAEEKLALARKIYDKFVKNRPEDDWEQPISVYESFFELYAKNKNSAKVDGLIEEMFGKSVRVPVPLIARFFDYAAEVKYPKIYKVVMVHFEMMGYRWTPELCNAAMNMFFSFGDYRRFRNTWDLCIDIGARPNTQSRTQMLEVYAKTGYETDAQFFYETQLRNGVEVDRKFHEIMMQNYIQRGYPGSALEISRELKKMGRPMTQEEISGIAHAYAKLGATEQLEAILKRIASPPKEGESTYTITSELLNSALEAYVQKEAAAPAQALWKKYNSLITLTPETAVQFMNSMKSLKLFDLVYSIFERVKVDHKFGSADAPEVWEIALNLPAFPSVSFADRLALLEDSEKFGISATPKMYRGALKLCLQYRSVTNALNLVKKFIAENGSLPLHRGVIVDFLAVLVELDIGITGQAARTWLNRLVNIQDDFAATGGVGTGFGRLTTPWGNDYDQYTDQLLSPTSTLQVTQFISRITADDLVLLPEDNKFEELFSGSAVDLEDQLIHKYGRDPVAVREALKDTEYEELQKRLDEIEKERNVLRNGDDWKN
eukprot:TRINITY_DN2558_c0_g1_i1.p1 TRINITY_DN2558_c0_g1~~TRINITY_DN2558_c0_g1_i1.p1  ORF type:complete len:882 (+),score=246.04 TRINITY_DN2558_c0_g1_i1:74-2719(+)